MDVPDYVDYPHPIVINDQRFSKSKFVLINNQQMSTIGQYYQECALKSNSRIGQFSNLTSVKILELVTKETRSPYSCLIFCIFVNNDIQCSDSRISIKELVNSISPIWGKERAIYFLLNYDNQSNQPFKNNLFKKDNIFISQNNSPKSNYFDDYDESCLNVLLRNICQDIIEQGNSDINILNDQMDVDEDFESDSESPTHSLVEAIYSACSNNIRFDQAWNMEQKSPSHYRNSHPIKRGKCLILNYEKFESTEMYCKSFTNFGFDVETIHGLSISDTKKALKTESEKDYSLYDCFAICVIAQCESEYFFCSDKRGLDLKSIFKYFQPNIFLKGIPKLFFISDCNNRAELDRENNKTLQLLVDDKISLPEDYVLMYLDQWQNSSKMFTELKHLTEKYDFATTIRMLFIRNALKNPISSNNFYFKSTYAKLMYTQNHITKYSNQLTTVNLEEQLCVEEESSFLVKRGLCLVVDIQEPGAFVSNSMQIAELANLFESVHFAVTQLQYDLNSPLYDFIAELFAKLENETPDCFVLIIFQNGNSKYVTNIMIESFISIPRLLDKPRLIFVFNSEKIHPFPESNLVVDSEYFPSRTSGTISSDRIIGSIRNNRNVSNFMLFYTLQVQDTVSVFCKNFKLLAKQGCDLMTILTKVSHELTDLPTVETLKRHLQFITTSTLKFCVYFEKDNSQFTNTSLVSVHKHLTSTLEEAYPLKKQKLVIIFANLQNKQLNYQINADFESIKSTFERLDFEIVCFCDLNSYKIYKELIKISKTNYSHLDCLCLCFIGHADDDGVLYCADEEYINTDDLIQSLSNNRTLDNKPKLVFIQGCRGEISNNPKKYSAVIKDLLSNQLDISHSVHPDLFVFSGVMAKCTCYAREQQYNAQTFIQLFCKMLMHYYQEYDLATISTILSREFTRKESNQRADRIPLILSTLTKQVIFHSRI